MWFSETRSFKLGSSKQRYCLGVTVHKWPGCFGAEHREWSRITPSLNRNGSKRASGTYSKSPCLWINSEGENWHNCEEQTSFNCSKDEKNLWTLIAQLTQLETSWGHLLLVHPTQNRERPDRFTLGWRSLSRRSLRSGDLSSYRATAGKGNHSNAFLRLSVLSFCFIFLFPLSNLQTSWYVGQLMWFICFHYLQWKTNRK